MAYNKKLFSVIKIIHDKSMILEKELEVSVDNFKRITEINKILKNSEKLVHIYREYELISDSIDNFNSRMKAEPDLEMQELIRMDFEDAVSRVDKIEDDIKVLLLPKDENDDKNIIIEMRPAAGGDEASIFVANLYEAYSRYAQTQNWKIECTEMINDTHGISFVSFIISGDDVYAKMKYESGVHRVQRVPATESKGRVHTSTITVAIMPEVEDIQIEINKSDIREDRYCSSGAGGQHVNKTQSAVRLTHLPTGIVVACQEGKSQHSNRDTAMKLLKSKIYNYTIKIQQDVNAAERKSQVGRGDRSEKIRTYNYPQNRVTDHRIGFSLNRLDAIMQGDLEDIIQALIAEEQSHKMASFDI